MYTGVLNFTYMSGFVCLLFNLRTRVHQQQQSGFVCLLFNLRTCVHEQQQLPVVRNSFLLTALEAKVMALLACASAGC